MKTMQVSENTATLTIHATGPQNSVVLERTAGGYWSCDFLTPTEARDLAFLLTAAAQELDPPRSLSDLDMQLHNAGQEAPR